MNNSMRVLVNKLVMIYCLLLLAGCKEEIIHEMVPKGTLVGYTQDTYSYTPLANALITLEGTDPLITVNSDDKGKFTVTDLIMGTYNIVFSKPGYGTYKILGYAFTGGNVNNTLSPILMYKLPEFRIIKASATVS